MVIGLCACRSKYDLDMANHDWELQIVQDSDRVLYCSEELKENYQGAEVLSLKCKIDGEYVVLSDKENTWKIKYKENERTPESVIFDLEYEEPGNVYVGNAVLSVTEYADSTFEYTLVIQLADYSIQFFAD